MAQGTWDAISVSELEKNISQTRGALFYFSKNKNDLFIKIIDELFFPVFILSDDEKARLAICPIAQFFSTYSTPFDRVKCDLENSYDIPNAAQALFNVIIQAQKHYPGFSVRLKNAIEGEQSFISELTGQCSNELLNYNRILICSIGNIFVDSLRISI